MTVYYIKLPAGSQAGQFVSAQTNVSGVLPGYQVRQYNSSSVVVNDKQFIMGQAAADGSDKVTEQLAPQYEDNVNAVAAVAYRPLPVASYYPSFTGSLNTVASGTFKASAATLLSVYVSNNSLTPVFFGIYNQTTTPGQAVAPVCSWPVPAGSGGTGGAGVLSLPGDALGSGHYLSTGGAWACSLASGSNSEPALATRAGLQVQIRYV